MKHRRAERRKRLGLRASPLGNEGCGLKLGKPAPQPVAQGASPLGNEGCGLKLTLTQGC